MKDSPLDNFNIQIVANHVIKWEELSRYLELSDSEEKKIKYDHPKDYKEQKYRCIKCWAEKNGKRATLKNLLRLIYYNLKDRYMLTDIVEDITKESKRSGEQISTT